MFPHISVKKRLLSHQAGFPLDLLDIWGGGASARDKVLMGGLMRGAWTLMGGPDFDRLYHKLKVLLLLLLLLLC